MGSCYYGLDFRQSCLQSVDNTSLPLSALRVASCCLSSLIPGIFPTVPHSIMWIILECTKGVFMLLITTTDKGKLNVVWYPHDLYHPNGSHLIRFQYKDNVFMFSGVTTVMLVSFTEIVCLSIPGLHPFCLLWRQDGSTGADASTELLASMDRRHGDTVHNIQGSRLQTHIERLLSDLLGCCAEQVPPMSFVSL